MRLKTGILQRSILGEQTATVALACEIHAILQEIRKTEVACSFRLVFSRKDTVSQRHPFWVQPELLQLERIKKLLDILFVLVSRRPHP